MDINSDAEVPTNQKLSSLHERSSESRNKRKRPKHMNRIIGEGNEEVLLKSNGSTMRTQLLISSSSRGNNGKLGSSGAEDHRAVTGGSVNRILLRKRQRRRRAMLTDAAAGCLPTAVAAALSLLLCSSSSCCWFVHGVDSPTIPYSFKQQHQESSSSSSSSFIPNLPTGPSMPTAPINDASASVPNNHQHHNIPQQQPPQPHDHIRKHNNNHNSNNDIRSTNSDGNSNNSLNSHHQQQVAREQQEFLDWCKNVMGIETILEIQTFPYYDYMRALPDQDWSDYDYENDDDDDEGLVAAADPSDFPMIPVRGLAASRDIQEGETVIRIPLQALLSVETTIDHDPILARAMGPVARRNNGWVLVQDDAGRDNNAEGGGSNTKSGSSSEDDEGTSLSSSSYEALEMAMLAVAILHHRKLGPVSPLSPYLRILETTNVDFVPYLWSKDRLRSEVSEGIRTVATGIRREIRDTYKVVVEPLIQQYPDLFGQRAASNNHDNKEWMFSFEHYQWAFAMLNSRHWQLPIPDLEAAQDRAIQEHHDEQEKKNHHKQQTHYTSSSVADEAPPASTPTDSWVEHEQQADAYVDETQDQDETSRRVEEQERHSFLAPVADLLNFGPPCTKGKYNQETRTFDIVASCSFLKGQEVTFWYSNECDHVMVGVFGFTHPMIPPCPSAEEYRRASQEWQARAEVLETQLRSTYADLDRLDEQLEHAEDILRRCDCCRHDYQRGTNDEKRGGTMLRAHGDGNDGHRSDEDIERRVRRTRQNQMSRKSEF